MVQYAKVGERFGIKTSAEELTLRFPKGMTKREDVSNSKKSITNAEFSIQEP